MTIVRRLFVVLAGVLGLLLTITGAVVLRLDGQLSAAPAATAEVVLAGARVTDLDLPAGDRVLHLQALTAGDAAGIGSSLPVQRITGTVELSRLAVDGRWPVVGWSLVAAGVLLLALVVVLRRRRSRRAGVTTAVGLLTLSLMLTGCSWTGDDVDRDAYRQARADLAAAFPADPAAAAVQFPAAAVAVTDPEQAASAALQQAGLPAEPDELATARFLTRQLFDPAVLCRSDDAGREVYAPVLEVFADGLRAAVEAEFLAVLSRADICGALQGGGMSLRSSVGSSTDTYLDGQYPGTEVTLTVLAGYQLTVDGRSLPFTIARTATLGFTDGLPGLAQTANLGGQDQGAGDGGLTGGRDAGAADADRWWNPVLWPDGGWDGEPSTTLVEPSPTAAAAVVGAVAQTMRAAAVELGRVRTWTGDGQTESSMGTGVLQPSTGAAQLTVEGSDATEIRVLELQRQFTDYPAYPVVDGSDAGKTWRLYETARQPALREGATTDNPYALLNWLQHLSAAAPTACPDQIVADSCSLVIVPTAELLTPGAPGYREALVDARRGNRTMTFAVGLDGGRLAAVSLDRELTGSDGSTSRVTTTWTFGADTTPVDIDQPPGYVVEDRR